MQGFYSTKEKNGISAARLLVTMLTLFKLLLDSSIFRASFEQTLDFRGFIARNRLYSQQIAIFPTFFITALKERTLTLTFHSTSDIAANQTYADVNIIYFSNYQDGRHFH